MVNPSKKKDPRFWKKWRESGAVGNMEDAYRVSFPEIMEIVDDFRELNTILSRTLRTLDERFERLDETRLEIETAKQKLYSTKLLAPQTLRYTH